MVRRLRVLHLGATQLALRGLRGQLSAKLTSSDPTKPELPGPPLLGAGILSLLRMLCSCHGVPHGTNQGTPPPPSSSSILNGISGFARAQAS